MSTSSLSLTQGLYYVVTGIWPLVSIRSFQWVTGPKYDLWLVKTVGVLIAVIGSVLMLAGLRAGSGAAAGAAAGAGLGANGRGRTSPEVALLAMGSAAGLTAIDVTYVARKLISPVYLLDALIQVGLIALWALSWSEIGDEHRSD